MDTCPQQETTTALRYRYSHAETRATTGYFSCEPVDAPDLRRALSMLEDRVHDGFLHRHVLGLLQKGEPELWLELAEKALAEKKAFLAALMLECAALLGPCGETLAGRLEALRHLADPAHMFTPFPLFAADPPDETAPEPGRAFADNILLHKPIPPDFSAVCARLYDDARLEETIREFEAFGGMLGRAHAEASVRGGEPAGDLKALYAAALDALQKAGVTDFPEMRHEASLSPIALLRQWRVRGGVDLPGYRHTLEGVGTAYGRGLSLAQARVSCIMEIVERASAHVSVIAGGEYGDGQADMRQSPLPLLRASEKRLEEMGLAFYAPPCAAARRSGAARADIYWARGRSAGGKTVFAPAQAAFLFANLPEPVFYENVGSTGLGAGAAPQQARLAALCEIIERDAHATTPFDAARCFNLCSRNAIVQGLLEDYRARGIHVQFQDISTETGVPAYRCFVARPGGGFAQATGAGLCGPRAALSALTETPWPYVWARAAPYGVPSAPGARNLPFRVLEDLPDFSLGNAGDDLALLEEVLRRQNREPVYVDLARSDLGFPVVRAFIPGLETDGEPGGEPCLRLVARQRLHTLTQG